MSKTQPWWKMRPGFKKATAAASLSIVAFIAVLSMMQYAGSRTDRIEAAESRVDARAVRAARFEELTTEEREAYSAKVLSNIRYMKEQAKMSGDAVARSRSDGLPVSQSTWPGEWPLTVSEGTLECKDGQPVFVQIVGGKKIYWALTGHARRVGKEIDPIWRFDRGPYKMSGARVNIGDMTKRARGLCP